VSFKDCLVDPWIVWVDRLELTQLDGYVKSRVDQSSRSCNGVVESAEKTRWSHRLQVFMKFSTPSHRSEWIINIEKPITEPVFDFKRLSLYHALAQPSLSILVYVLNWMTSNVGIVMVCAIEQYDHFCSIMVLQFNTAQWQCAGLDPRMKQHKAWPYIDLLLFSVFSSRVDF
jgi:hypothetical protein